MSVHGTLAPAYRGFWSEREDLNLRPVVSQTAKTYIHVRRVSPRFTRFRGVKRFSCPGRRRCKGFRVFSIVADIALEEAISLPNDITVPVKEAERMVPPAASIS
jgi:hypothetical protein